MAKIWQNSYPGWTWLTAMSSPGRSASRVLCWMMERALTPTFDTWKREIIKVPVNSVADPGFLSRIQIFSSRIQGQNGTGSLSKNRKHRIYAFFLTPIIVLVTKLFGMWSVMFIADPGSGIRSFFPSQIPDPEWSKSTGSRSRIRTRKTASEGKKILSNFRSGTRHTEIYIIRKNLAGWLGNCSG